MGRRAWLVVAALLSVVLFTAVVFVTGFLACGISGCSGAGFGSSFAPAHAQVGLLVAGISLVPLTLLLLRGRRRLMQAAGAAAGVAAGSVLAMFVLGLGPNGCPWGQSQATTGPGAFSPGSLTCSGDRNARPPN